MAGTALNWNTINIPRGKRVMLFGKVAAPGAGARITLATDGTPDATANPNAIPLGRTVDGAELQYATTLQNRNSDEFDAPFDTSIEIVEGIISCNLMLTADMDVMNIIMPGTTKTTGTGYEQLTAGGLSSVTKISVVAICEMPEDSTKFLVFHLYSAVNNQKLAWRLRHSSNAIGSTPVAFQGYSVSSRAVGDQVLSYWKTVA